MSSPSSSQNQDGDLDVALIIPSLNGVEMLRSNSPGPQGGGLARQSSPTGMIRDPIPASDDYTYDEYLRGPPNGILRRWKHCKMPTETWGRGHTLYMTVFGMLIPTLVCFACNFGVAVGIFRGNPPPTLWQFPIPLAGNYAAIIIVQTLINFPLVGALSTFDTLNGLCPSLSPRRLFTEMDPDTWLGWFLQPSELVYAPVLDKSKAYWRRILDTLKRAFAWILLQFILIWPLFTGISYRIWGETNYNAYPQPEFISATMGGVLALCTCPLWTFITMISMGTRIEEECASHQNSMRYDSTGGLGRFKSAGPVSLMI